MGLLKLWRFKSFNNSTAYISSISPATSYSILSEEPETHSKLNSPSTTRKTHKPNLKVLNINCQSIVNKKAEFQAIIDELKPDIVVGTDYWLNI